MLCPACSYELGDTANGTLLRCPECGRQWSAHRLRHWARLPTRRRILLWMLTPTFLALALFLGSLPAALGISLRGLEDVLLFVGVYGVMFVGVLAFIVPPIVAVSFRARRRPGFHHSKWLLCLLAIPINAAAAAGAWFFFVWMIVSGGD